MCCMPALLLLRRCWRLPVPFHPVSGTTRGDQVLSAAGALEALDSLPADAPAAVSWGEGGSRTGWFGQAWEDVDGDGCDTRNEILSRDLTDADYSRANGIQSRDEGVGQGAAVCPDATVWSGTLHDPYTGSTMPSSVARAPRRRFRSTMWCL